MSAEDADQLLKQPVRNKETVIRAMKAAASITPPAIRKLSVQAAMETYPYLKQTDLVRLDLCANERNTECSQIKSYQAMFFFVADA